MNNNNSMCKWILASVLAIGGIVCGCTGDKEIAGLCIIGAIVVAIF